MTRKVSIIILNYNSWEETLKEIKLCSDIFCFDYNDIIVVDNASPNESAEKLYKESLSKGFHFIKSNDNKGYAAGNNIGLRYAFMNGYNYSLILNNDIIFDDKHMIEKIIDVFSKDERIAVVNTDVYSPNGRMFNRDAKRQSILDYTIGAFTYKKKGRKINDLGGYAYIYRPQGCCMMVDLEKLDEIGYMDENTFLYWEEPILAERLSKKGYRCALCTTSKITHNHSLTVKTVMDKKKRCRIENESFRYYLKEYRGYNIIQIWFCLVFNSIKAFLSDM